MPITYQDLTSSSFLDYQSYRSGATTPTDGVAIQHFSINVALTFERANDPTTLLDSSWGVRQQQLKALNDSGTLWSTYGANEANYNAAEAFLGTGVGSPITILDSHNSGYVSSAEARTIWVHLNESNFSTLFNTTLLSSPSAGTWYWNGNLSLPKQLTDLGVTGLWFDSSGFSAVLPNPGSGTGVTLPQGWQSPGNGAASASTALYPHLIANDHYNFPLAGAL